MAPEVVPGHVGDPGPVSYYVCAEKNQQPDGQPLMDLHPGVVVEEDGFICRAALGKGEPEYEPGYHQHEQYDTFDSIEYIVYGGLAHGYLRVSGLEFIIARA